MGCLCGDIIWGQVSIEQLCLWGDIIWGHVSIEWGVYEGILFGDKVPLINYFYFGDIYLNLFI